MFLYFKVSDSQQPTHMSANCTGVCACVRVFYGNCSWMNEAACFTSLMYVSFRSLYLLSYQPCFEIYISVQSFILIYLYIYPRCMSFSSPPPHTHTSANRCPSLIIYPYGSKSFSHLFSPLLCPSKPRQFLSRSVARVVAISGGRGWGAYPVSDFLWL